MYTPRTYSCPIKDCTGQVENNGALCTTHIVPPGLYWARLDASQEWDVIEVGGDGRSQCIGWDAGAFPTEIGPRVIKPEGL